MKQIFELEAGYLVIALFLVITTYIVTTRSFMPKGAFKKGMTAMLLMVITIIGFHYYLTIQRMNEVKNAFLDGKTILCENRESFKGPNSIIVKKSAGWELKNNIFSKDGYYKKFHTARCIVDIFQ